MFTRNLQEIGHFLAVAQSPSLSAAARQLQISQPALTTSIRKLETELGFDLFDRENSFQLTLLGREFLVRAESAFLGVKDLGREADLLRSGSLGEIRAACGPNIADGMMGKAIGRLLHARPELKIRMHVGSFAEMPGMLRNRRIDFFVADFSLLTESEGLEIQPFAPQPIVFFCRAGHPLADRDEVSMEEAFSWPHVGTALPVWVETWLRENRPEGIEGRGLRVECCHHAVLNDIVANSDAISGAPLRVINPAIDQGRLAIVNLNVAPMVTRAGVVWLRSRPPTPAGQFLIDELKLIAAGE